MIFLAKVLVAILNLESRRRLWRKEVAGKNDEGMKRRVFLWGALSCCIVAVELQSNTFYEGFSVAFFFSVLVTMILFWT